MASSLDPRIIVLALGAGALGFPDALRVLLQIAGQSPVTDVAICAFAMGVVTAQALGAVLLARFVRKARAGGDASSEPPPRTDRFAEVTLVVSLGVAILVSACLLVASGAGARVLGLLQLVGDVARETKSPVIAALATGAAAAGAASSSTGTGRFRFASTARVASFTGAAAAAAFLLAKSGGLFMRRGSLVGVAAAVVGTVLLARFTFTRRARNRHVERRRQADEAGAVPVPGRRLLRRPYDLLPRPHHGPARERA